MEFVRIDAMSDFVGHQVRIRGWVRGSRSSGKLVFLEVRDGSGSIQCTAFRPEVDEEVFARAKSVTQETSIVVTGTVRVDDRAQGGLEVSLSDIEVVGAAQEYPISPKEHGAAFLHDRRHLWLRSSRQHAILRVRASVIAASRRYFDSRGFTLVDAPIFTPAACEGTSSLFEVDYFGDSAYLTQSGQLYMEAAAMALGKVYCLGPTFRAEKSKTRRHLTEFWMLEPEVAYMDLEGDIDLAEDFLVTVVAEVVSERSKELDLLGRDLAALAAIRKPFPRISYTEALEILREAGVDKEWGGDLGAEEETLLANQYDRPLIVHRYPATAKAFYMKPDPENASLALCVDILAPEGYGEIVGGGEREEDLASLEERILEHGLDPETLGWYLDLRRYGSVPHAGFGLGIERTVAWICGLHHVRETIPFPRMLERLTP